MNSIDTNILIYATNSSCKEHEKAILVYEELLRRPYEWIIADQVLFEFYRALRNPKVLEHPLSHSKAFAQICFIREKVGCLHCSYSCKEWESLCSKEGVLSKSSKHIFDLVLAVTLQANDVDCFYTRNVEDFEKLKFFELVNPID